MTKKLSDRLRGIRDILTDECGHIEEWRPADIAIADLADEAADALDAHDECCKQITDKLGGTCETALGVSQGIAQLIYIIRGKDAEIDRLKKHHCSFTDCKWQMREIKAEALIAQLEESIRKALAKLDLDAKDQQLTDLRSTMHVELVQKDAEIERLNELSRNDAEEIGSYIKGTGLRGEWRAMKARLELLEEVVEDMQSIAASTCCGDCREAKRVAIASLAKLDKA